MEFGFRQGSFSLMDCSVTSEERERERVERVALLSVGPKP